MKKVWECYFPTAITDEKIKEFAMSIGDTNPIHHDTGKAREVGLKGIIAPGIMILGFASVAIANEIPMARVVKLEMKFRKPLYAGSQLLIKCSMSKVNEQLIEIRVTVGNKTDTDIAARGSCLALLPVSVMV